MRRFLHIFGIYALVVTAIFILQWIPATGIFLMFFLGMFWIGVIVHLFMIQITVMSIMGALPRPILILPGAFYAAGLATGLSSDIPASNWKSQQQWLRIDKQVPPDTRDVEFATGIYTISVELSHQDRAFEPEKLGFELFVFRSSSEPTRRLIFQSAATSWCPSGQITLAGRCFTTSPIDHPSSYLVIGGNREGCPAMPVMQLSWATIYPDCEPIRFLDADGNNEIVGHLFGAIIRKRSYFLFPTAGCMLIDSPPSWPCQWYVSPLWRDAYVGYHLSPNGSSPSAASTLMAALAQLRGQTAPP
jgi:hypothetical protein